MPSGAEAVSLRDYIIGLIERYRELGTAEHRLISLHMDDVEKRLTLMHDAEVARVATMILADEKARDLYRGEVDKRLDNLNHSQDKIERIQNTYVPREVYEKRVAQVDEKVSLCLPRAVFDVAMEHAQEERKDLTGFQNRVNETLARMAERKAVFAAVIAAMLALAGTIAQLLMQQPHPHP